MEAVAQDADGAAQPITAYLNTVEIVGQISEWASASIRDQTMGSEISIMGPSDHWPRDRAIAVASPVVATPDEFKQFVESFVAAWPNAGRIEKARLLVHWLGDLALRMVPAA